MGPIEDIFYMELLVTPQNLRLQIQTGQNLYVAAVATNMRHPMFEKIHADAFYPSGI